ncbi:hypothetical protein KP509_09G007500 [Ceratopteris richardii]|uniref:S1 motif domain-containing protein n=1 Tax=Ceratopteris richardii TaxID=49495 RepID=A0A8T2TYM9_CERRI|nr:hypothetical protein KP509_09G007500 [Ceratopteris richardii]
MSTMTTNSIAGCLRLSCASEPYEESLGRMCRFQCRRARSSCTTSVFFQESLRSAMVTIRYRNDSSIVPVMSFESIHDSVETHVDAGIKLSNIDSNPDILDIQYRENNRAAPPIVPLYPSSDGDNGATEFDFEIYAFNSMENYEPPPQHPAPFSYPFEDYYGEAVGVDYISKEERPASSLLRFLNTLNENEKEKNGDNANEPAFPSSVSNLDKTDKGKAHKIYKVIDGWNVQQTMDDGSPIKLSSRLETNASRGTFSPSTSITDVSGEQPSVLPSISHDINSVDGQRSNDQRDFIDDSLHTASPRVIPTTETRDSDVSPFSAPVLARNPYAGLNESRKAALLDITSKDGDEQMKVIESYQAGNDQQSKCIASTMQGKEFSSPINIPVSAFSQHVKKVSKENLTNRGSVLTSNESDIREDIDTSDKSVDHILESPSVDTRRKIFSSAQALRSSTRASSISQFYIPQEGDLVVGAVTFINDQKVDLEIGAELCALMPLKDLHSLFQHGDSTLIEISGENCLNVPLGESFIMKEDDIVDHVFCNSKIDVGTVILAEVIGKTIIDGRAILSCKSYAQKLAWHRINQLMQLGETIQIKITQWNQGGLLGYFEGVRAFIPISELLKRLESFAFLRDYVGRTLTVAVVKADKQRSNIIASEVQAWKENGLLLRDKEQVFRDADEMGRRFIEGLSEKERKLFSVRASGSTYNYTVPDIANLAWLYNQDTTP